jgi:hypothetical protein
MSAAVRNFSLRGIVDVLLSLIAVVYYQYWELPSAFYVLYWSRGQYIHKAKGRRHGERICLRFPTIQRRKIRIIIEIVIPRRDSNQRKMMAAIKI